jgi:hypothetical protein
MAELVGQEDQPQLINKADFEIKSNIKTVTIFQILVNYTWKHEHHPPPGECITWGRVCRHGIGIGVSQMKWEIKTSQYSELAQIKLEPQERQADRWRRPSLKSGFLHLRAST